MEEAGLGVIEKPAGSVAACADATTAAAALVLKFLPLLKSLTAAG